MNFPLASGHENSQLSPATAMPEADLIILCEVPLIAELEAMIAAGKGWSRDFDARVDEVSIALFGVTEADTRPAEPKAEHFAHARTGRLDDDAYQKARGDHWHMLLSFESPTEKAIGLDDFISWWAGEGVDVNDAADSLPLRCLPNLQRQLRAAMNGTLPGAKLTLDGTGTRGTASAEAWGASLAADAAKFRTKR